MPIRHDMLGHWPTDTERTFIALADGQLGTTHCSVHENILKPGAVVPWHAHPVEEIIVCLAGEGECTVEGSEPQCYSAGSVVLIPANTPHSLRNAGAGHLQQLAVLGGVTPGTRWIEPEGSVAKVRGEAR